MCETCGCSDTSHGHIHEHEHDGHKHSHEHTHDPKHTHDHPHSHDHSHLEPGGRIIQVETDILYANNLMAERNRGYLDAKKILTLNLVSSPGSGKTTILEKTIHALTEEAALFVIEGDQQTNLDAARIDKAGAPAVQINTGKGCHLDAQMIRKVLDTHELVNHSILFIENVGNLVCPAMFDLGEKFRVIIMSVAEGDDKPLKYPHMFHSSQLCLINKIDLLPYVDFSVEKAKSYALHVNPAIQFIEVSAKTGEGMQAWFDWLRGKL
jgi:hydrogenase nickel incorporation protein HypB